MDACADESLYHFTATVSHTNFNKTVHLVHLGGWDRSGFQWGGTQQIFIREGSAPRSNPLPFLTEKVVPLLYSFHWQMLPLSHT